MAEGLRLVPRFTILTIFPSFFESILASGVVGRALRLGIAEWSSLDLRSFTADRHRTVDDRPFGGGEGMVLKPEPIFAAVDSLDLPPKNSRDQCRDTVILLSAQGERYTQAVAHELAACKRIVLICGRYEGVDERVAEHLADRELSIGDYVLSGGELGAAVIIDSVVRLLPGALGNADSAHYESFGTEVEGAAANTDLPLAVSPAAGLLDYPHYTRPPVFGGHSIPEVLTGGDHAAIRRWRREQAIAKTLRYRPELLQRAPLSPEDRRTLERLRSESGAS